jgi:hypothetical protein
VNAFVIEPSTDHRQRHPTLTQRRSAKKVLLGSRLRVITAMCLLMPVLVACGDDDSDPADPTAVATVAAPVPSAEAPPSTEVPEPVQIVAGDPVWTTSVEAGTNRPLDEVEGEFDATAPVIYAAVSIVSAPAGSLLVASWTYNNTPIQGMDETVQLPEVRFDPIWLEFHLERQAGDEWPDGEYRITLHEGDRVVSEGTIEVVVP